MTTNNVTAPYWARWKARQVDVQPWATVRLSAQYGHRPCSLLSIGRGWVSVRVQYSGGPRCEVYPPSAFVWSSARTSMLCKGIRVTSSSGVHELDAMQGEGMVWRWVARAIEANATVEPVF